MAFLTRSLRVFHKIYNAPRAAYSTLRPPATRVNLTQVLLRKYTIDTNSRPKIASSLTNIQSLKVDPPPPNQEKSDDTDEQEKENKKKSRWQDRRLYILAGGVIVVLIAGSINVLADICLPPESFDDLQDLPPLQAWYMKTVRGIVLLYKVVKEPSRKKLLPDPLQYPYVQPPYTVVLEMSDVLVHAEWTYQTGWRFKKRPGLDKFLEAVAPPQFELVVFTAQTGMTAFPLLDAMDPNGYIMYRLVRDATRFEDGHHIKDLSVLNRDLSKVIVVDWNPESMKMQPENALIIPRWTGNDDDTTLQDLAAFLKTILETEIEDVREVLRNYRQFEDPLKTFVQTQRKLQSELEEQRALENTKVLTSKYKPSFMGWR